MSVQDELTSTAARLRRYARALVAGHPGHCESADDLVQETLRRAGVAGGRGDMSHELYSLLTELHREAARTAAVGARASLETGGFRAGGQRPAENLPSLSLSRDRLSGAIGGLQLEEREALLLVVLEGFSYSRAARILKISVPILIARLTRARGRLGDLSPTAAQGKTKLRPTYLRLVE